MEAAGIEPANGSDRGATAAWPAALALASLVRPSGRAKLDQGYAPDRINAPMNQTSGKKIPKKNIQPWPFLNVMTPSVTRRSTYRKTPIPIPHHI